MGKFKPDIAAHEETFRRVKEARAQAMEQLKRIRELHAQRRELLRSLIDAGFSRTEIAKELGVTRQAIAKMLA
jgi:DNA invertase Pin-like site-specific DNA recombinase